MRNPQKKPTVMNSFSKYGQSFMKEAKASILCFSIELSIHHNSFKLFNRKSPRPKMTPAEGNHLGIGTCKTMSQTHQHPSKPALRNGEIAENHTLKSHPQRVRILTLATANRRDRRFSQLKGWCAGPSLKSSMASSK